MKLQANSAELSTKRIRQSNAADIVPVELEQLNEATVVQTNSRRRSRSQELADQRKDAVAKPTKSFEDELLESIRQGAWAIPPRKVSTTC